MTSMTRARTLIQFDTTTEAAVALYCALQDKGPDAIILINGKDEYVLSSVTIGDGKTAPSRVHAYRDS